MYLGVGAPSEVWEHLAECLCQMIDACQVPGPMQALKPVQPYDLALAAQIEPRLRVQ